MVEPEITDVAAAAAGPTPSLILLIVVGLLFLAGICLSCAIEYKKRTKEIEIARRRRRVADKLQRISDEIEIAKIVEYHQENNEPEK